MLLSLDAKELGTIVHAEEEMPACSTGVQSGFADDASSDPAVVALLPQECRLCPRACGVNRAAGQRGFCGAGNQLRIARAALHYWEEPPISADAGSGTVFLSYCPLRCDYCQNSVIADGRAGKAVSLERLVQMCLELQSQGALNINFVTPTHYAPVIAQAVKEAHQRGLALPVVWNTGGYEYADAIRALAGTVDVYLTDFKYASSELAARYSHAADYPVRAFEALSAMVEQAGEPCFDEFNGQLRMTRGVVVRHLMLPGCLDDSKAVLRLLNDAFGDSIIFSIMDQYTSVLSSAAQAGDAHAASVLQRCPELACTVSEEEYEQLLDYADSLGIEDYFWQQGGAAEESFIPPFDLTGV